MTIRTLLEAADKATPGPWEVCLTPLNEYWKKGKTVGAALPSGVRVCDTYEGFTGTHPEYGDCEKGADAHFIESARNSIEDLRKLVEWVKALHHDSECDCANFTFATDEDCSCGLSEILRLLS